MIKGMLGQKRDYKKRMADDMAMASQLPQEPKKPSFFGEGGMGRSIAGALGDVLLQNNGLAPMYAPQMRQKQRMEFAQDQYEQRRADRQNEWIQQQQWLRDNPKPVNNDTVNDYNFIKETAGEGAAKQFIMNKANPPQYRQGADGRFYRIETAPNRPAVGSIIKDPRKAGPASAPGNFQR